MTLKNNLSIIINMLMKSLYFMLSDTLLSVFKIEILMASLETDTRTRQNWFNGKQPRFEQHFSKTMKSNGEEREKYGSPPGKAKHESSRPMGTKVSTIAHMFQSLSQQKSESNLVKSPVGKDASSPLSDRVQSPDGYKTERSASLPAFPNSNCSLSRRGSHLARFNNAKAMFEKLEKSKSDSKNSADSKPRANTIPNEDCTKFYSNVTKKKPQDCNISKTSDTDFNIEKSSLKKVNLNNDKFSKVTAETLKPIWANHSKKSETINVPSENKNTYEKGLYQKIILQNENNLDTSLTNDEDVFQKKVDSFKKEESGKGTSFAATHDIFAVKTEVNEVKSEKPLLISDCINKFNAVATEENKCSSLKNVNSEYKSNNLEYKPNVSEVSSANKNAVLNNILPNDIDKENSSIDSEVSGVSIERKESHSSSFTVHQKVGPSLSTDSDLVYDNFQRALDNSNQYAKSSPFKIQVDNLRNRTFDVDTQEKKTDSELSSSSNEESNLQQVVIGKVFLLIFIFYFCKSLLIYCFIDFFAVVIIFVF